VSAEEEDVQALLLDWMQAWPKWLADTPNAEVIVDFTSGTKPMSAAAFALAVSRGAARVSYVVGERDQTGRVTKSTGVAALSPDLVVAHRQLRRAVAHFHAGSFAAARDAAEPYARRDGLEDESLREIARSIHLVAKAYEAWDRFDWTAAGDVLRKSRRYWANWTWLESTELLERNAELIAAAEKSRKAEDYAPALCADLLASVQRRIDREEWDDAVVRLYRACELLAQSVLWRDFGQTTDDIDPAKVPPGLRAKYEDRQSKSPSGKLRLGLESSYRLLEELGHALGQEFRKVYGDDENRGDLQGLLSTRNNSLLAHGTVPIKEDKARRLHRALLDLAPHCDAKIVDEWLPKARAVRLKEF
jgi:CRISPR-associated protein (TIGR02710 family)